MKTNYTFWELLNIARIEIPIIQRDYAQGRKNRKTDDIRRTFVEQLKTALENKDPMHLNFVYGKLQGIANKEKQDANRSALQNMIESIRMYSKNLDLDFDIICQENFTPIHRSEKINSISFIPLDGQQRLTTLYLLHWYILSRLGNDEEKILLNNFSYLIRPSSKSFCEALINEKIALEKNTVSVSEKLQDAIWFHLYWKKDPTINGMMNMLDEIHFQFKDVVDFEMYWEALTVKRKINFDFLNLDDYHLTDDLYVKMNARGLTLTPYENFKSWLIEYIEDKETANEKFIIKNRNWKNNFDKAWADLFWHNKDEGNFLIDEEFMRFIRNMFQLFYVRDNDIKDSKTAKTEEKKIRENVVLLATTKNKDGEFKDEYIYVSNEKFVKLNVLTNSNLNEIFEILDLLADSAIIKLYSSARIIELNFMSDKSYFKSFVTGQMTYSDKALFYALIQFLQKISKDEIESAEDKLISWMRITRNLILNSTIDDRANFARAIKGIDLLVKNCDGIINYVANCSSNFYGFSENQSIEEIEKAKLIEKDFEFEKLFLKYENHKLFKGSISFLLKLANEENGINKIKDYYPIFNLLFKEDGTNFGYLLIRAILANSSLNEDVRLLNNAANWRDLLKKEVIIVPLIKTIERIHCLTNGNLEEIYVESILSDIVSKYDDKSILWKYYIIKNDILLTSNASRSKYVKNYWGNIYLFNNEGGNWINNTNQFILSNLRNEIISKVTERGIFELDTNSDWWVKKDKETGTVFYRGEHVWLKKRIDNYHFWLQFAQSELFMGVRISDIENVEISDNLFGNNTSWLIFSSLSYPANVDDIQEWINELMRKFQALTENVKPKNNILV